MSGIVIKIMWGLVSKLMTEMFVGRVLVYGLNQISQSTNNKLDDAITSAVAEALGVAVPK